MTELSERVARYAQREREADALGRLIEVRRLKPSERIKLEGFLSDLTGVIEGEGTDGTKISMPRWVTMLPVASVSKIDDVHVAFPRSRGELDAILDRLDDEGMSAATAALTRLHRDEAVIDPEEAAKN
ncbi:hypothetical protein [Bradyrhizobium sp. Ai1a-2]|uniref:hypothetical protein n=1 Tax=Bradyrhizobium sp. Ai1a-2 TaxID=196490 RepID=UPI00040D8D07|nr:hypothetical protein [Bradyrhizobium sp. Ai1a-2]